MTQAIIYANATQRIEILEIEYGINDYVKFQWCYEELRQPISRSKIFYNAKGEPYFITYKRRWYLNEAIKVN